MKTFYQVNEDGCWIWLKAKDKKRGYGYSFAGPGKSRKAHRIIYEMKYGPIPKGLELDHICGITACVNPDHLEPVTHAVNVQRGKKVKLTPEKVKEIRSMWELTKLLTQEEIGKKFGVTQQIVSKIVNHKLWKNI